MSVGLKFHETTLVLFPGLRLSEKLVEQEIVGVWLSTIVMPKLQVDLYPAAVVAVHEMIFVPTGNVVVPKSGQTTGTLMAPLASVAVAMFQFTTPVAAFVEVYAEIFGEQLMTGGVTSATIT